MELQATFQTGGQIEGAEMSEQLVQFVWGNPAPSTLVAGARNAFLLGLINVAMSSGKTFEQIAEAINQGFSEAK